MVRALVRPCGRQLELLAAATTGDALVQVPLLLLLLRFLVVVVVLRPEKPPEINGATHNPRKYETKTAASGHGVEAQNPRTTLWAMLYLAGPPATYYPRLPSCPFQVSPRSVSFSWTNGLFVSAMYNRPETMVITLHTTAWLLYEKSATRINQHPAPDDIHDKPESVLQKRSVPETAILFFTLRLHLHGRGNSHNLRVNMGGRRRFLSLQRRASLAII
jgi:hypothetical protein